LQQQNVGSGPCSSRMQEVGFAAAGCTGGIHWQSVSAQCTRWILHRQCFGRELKVDLAPAVLWQGAQGGSCTGSALAGSSRWVLHRQCFGREHKVGLAPAVLWQGAQGGPCTNRELGEPTAPSSDCMAHKHEHPSLFKRPCRPPAPAHLRE